VSTATENIARVIAIGNTPTKQYPIKPKVGDIFYTSWGYDQTNVEFFKVVRVSPSSVWVQETGQKREYSDYGNGDYWTTVSNGEPLVRELRNRKTGEIDKVPAPITIHRIKEGREGKPCIRINSFTIGWFWDGQPVHASTGH
jgi:hypothetical protein